MSVKGWKIRQKGLELNSEVIADFDRQGFVRDDGKNEKTLSIHGEKWDLEVDGQVNIAISPPSEQMAELIFKGFRMIMPGESFFTGTSFWRQKVETLCNPKPMGVGIEYGGFWSTICWPVYFGKIHHPRFQGRILDKISQQLEKVDFDPTLVRLAMNNIMDLYFLNKEGTAFARVMDISFAKTADGVAFSIAGAVSGDPLVRSIRGLVDRPEGKYWMGSLLEPLLNGVDLDVRIHPAGGLEIQGRVPFWKKEHRGELLIQDLRNLKGQPEEPGLILTQNIISHFGDFGDKVQRELHVIEKRIIQQGQKVAPAGKIIENEKIVERNVEVGKKEEPSDEPTLFSEPSIEAEPEIRISADGPIEEEKITVGHWEEKDEAMSVISGEAQRFDDGFNVIQGSGYEKEVRMMLGGGDQEGYGAKREEAAWVIQSGPAEDLGDRQHKFVVAGGGSVVQQQGGGFNVISGDPSDLGDQQHKMVIKEGSKEIEIVQDPELLAELRRKQREMDAILMDKAKLEELLNSKDELNDAQAQQLRDRINQLMGNLSDKEDAFRDARQKMLKTQSDAVEAAKKKEAEELLVKDHRSADEMDLGKEDRSSQVIGESQADKDLARGAERDVTDKVGTGQADKDLARGAENDVSAVVGDQPVVRKGMSEEDIQKEAERLAARQAQMGKNELDKLKKDLANRQKQIELEREKFEAKLKESGDKELSDMYEKESAEQKRMRIEQEAAIKARQAEIQRLEKAIYTQETSLAVAEKKQVEETKKRVVAEVKEKEVTEKLHEVEAEFKEVERESQQRQAEFEKEVNFAKEEMEKLHKQKEMLMERMTKATPAEKKQLQKDIDSLMNQIDAKERFIEETNKKIQKEMDYRAEQQAIANEKIAELNAEKQAAMRAARAAENSDKSSEINLRNKVKELENLLSSRDKIIERNEKVVEQIQEKTQKQIEMMNEKLEQEREIFEKGRGELNEMRSNLAELQRELKATELNEDQQLAQAKTEARQLKSEVGRKEGIIDKIQKRFNQTQEESAKQIQLLKSQLDDEKHALREFKAAASGGKDSGLGAAKDDASEIKRLNMNVDTLKKRITELTEGPNGVTVLRKKLAEAEGGNANLRDQAKRAENQLKLKEEEFKKRLVKFAGWEEERTKDKTKINTLEAEAKRTSILMKQFDDMKKQNSLLVEKVKKLQVEARGGAASGGASELKLKQMTSILENSRKEIARLKERSEKAHGDSNKYKSEAVKLQNELTQVKKKLEKYEPADKDSKKAG